MLKNKIIVKKIRNIFILLMAIIIMLGAYHNIRNSRAENVIQIEMEVSDKSDILSAQTITVDATETSKGNYLLELPISVNGNIVTKYYTSSGEEILIDAENDTVTIQLTDEEVTNQKVQLQTDYDTKEVTYNDETKLFYNKELQNTPNEDGTENKDVTVTGYMPLDAKLEVTEVDLATLTSVKLPNEKQTMQKGYEVSIFEMVKKQVSETTESNVQDTETEEEATQAKTEETTDITVEKEEMATDESTENIETERVEYDPSVYGEKITIKTKYAQENAIITTYNLAEDNTVTEIASSTDEENIKFETEKTDKTVRYIIATEEIENEELPQMSVMNDDSDITFSTTATSTTTSSTLKSTSSESSETSGFLGNTSIQRQNIENVTFVNGSSSITNGLLRSYDATHNAGSGSHSSSTTTWKDLSGNQDGTLNGGTWGSNYLSLDGVDDWVNLGQVNFSTNRVTLDVTISIDAIQSDKALILNNLEQGGACIYLQDGKPSFYIYIEGTGYVEAMSSTTLTTGKKTRLTGVYDGTKLYLYVDGELVAQKSQTGNVIESQENTVMAIGVNPKHNGAQMDYAKVKVYSAKVYNIALTKGEINAWDVSEAQDGSIMAWTNNTSAPYTVYIGSNSTIFANQDSSYLFAYIGYGSSCTATEGITNINLLNTSNVTNMAYMFVRYGKNGVTSLDLGSNFDTSKVTDMRGNV